MADYYRILSGAIENQNISGEAARQAMYARAKTALEAQFESMDQELVADLIKTHQQNFDEAIAKIEREIKAAAAVTTPSPAETVVEPVKMQPGGSPSSSPQPPPQPPPKAPPKVQPPAYVASPSRTASSPGAAPQLSSPAIQPIAGNTITDEKKRSSAAIFFAILFVFVASVSALGLWKRDLVSGYSNQLGVMTGLWGKTETSMPAQGGQSAPDGKAESVEAANGSPPPTGHESPNPAPTAEVAAQFPQSPAQSPALNSSPGDDSAPVQNDPAGEGAESETTAQANEQPAAVNPIELPLRAFFLIEKSSGGSAPDDRYSGAAKWLFNTDTKTLRIETFFPRRNTELNIDFVANSDASFPASHTVTYQHTSLGENPDGAIINIPALMVREDAGSEGKPLKGAGALIVPDKYILGLSENPENVAINLNLINKAKWLVVPVVFDINNRRALFVIEKGPQGARAFAAALAAWGQSDLITE